MDAGLRDLLAERSILDLDPDRSAEAKVRRERVYHATMIPYLRRATFALFPLVMLAHNAALGIENGTRLALAFSGIYLAWVLGSSWALTRFLGRTGRVHLGDLFLAVDVVLFTGAVYCTGGEHSLLFILPFVHSMDQPHVGVRRSLGFAQIGLVAYLFMLGWLEFVEGRELALPLEATKLAFAYSMGMFVAITATASERVRRRSTAAIQLARDLIQHLHGKSEQLSESSLRAEEANRSKSVFLANMSHEIRTPLNGVIGMTELALGTDLNAEQRNYLTATRDSAESLMQILNDVLDFSKIEAGHLDVESIEFDLRDALSSSLRSLEAQAHARQLALTCRIDSSLPDCIVGDPLRLRQIVLNLASNAIKFTSSEPGRQGHVAIEAARDSDAEGRPILVLRVIDNGIGIPPEKREQIFSAFTQADGSTTRRFGGTGLGLAISSQLAGLMGGRLSIEEPHGDDVESGSSFRFELPLQVPGDEPEVRESSVSLEGRVMIVLESEVVREHAAALFRGLDVEVIQLSRADADLRLTSLDDGDAVLIDPISVEHLAPDTHAWLCQLERVPLLLLASAGEGRLTPRLGALPDRAQRIIPPMFESDITAAMLAARGESNAASNDPSMRDESRGLAKTRRSDRASERPQRILLVEDHPINQRLAQHHLHLWGHTVELAENGREAVEAWRANRHDLILMDVHMPEMDGLEATQLIRLEERTGERVPIIALTANTMAGDADRCRAAGMDEHVAKPIDFRFLYDTIESYSARRSNAA